MGSLLAAVNAILSFITPISDFFWDFPKNFEWYREIPLLGDFSLAIIVLVGSGIYFTLSLGFIQIKYFKKGIKLLIQHKQIQSGISPLTAFFLSSAMRVGPGNIIGVTGAIATGGPGALFWMWISAFFGMATAYTESVLSQLFKEKRGDVYVGGLPFYARQLLGNKAWIGVVLSCIYILYAMFCLPAQGFNVVSSMGAIAEIFIGNSISVQSSFYYIVSTIVIILAAVIAFGGIKRVTKATNAMVPIMAIIYILTVAFLIVTNTHRIPYFFQSVFSGAFTPEAIFGGAFGTALVQGVKRGLMSNEAGQGTITMAAAAADARHPSEQGLIAALGVFLDTHIICTMTAFIIIMAHRYMIDPQGWEAAETYSRFLMSISSMTPGFLETVISFLLSLCFSMFAYTCVIGMVTFSEISARRISDNPIFVTAIRILCIFVSAFGILSSIAGYDLSRMWAFEDLGNIVIVYVNILMLHIGFKYVKLATKHFERYGNVNFISRDVIGIDTPYWRKGSDIE